MKKLPNPQGSFIGNVKNNDRKQLKLYKITITIVAVVLILVVGMTAISAFRRSTTSNNRDFSSYDIPEYDSQVFEVLNNNVPYFNPDEYGITVFEEYSDLDAYGRCGVAFANICHEIMPTEPRGEIRQIKPSGWKQEKYLGVVDSEPPYFYNRCHLIGFQLAGENDNEKNLITGTRFFNVEGMLPFENAVRNYVDETNDHVLYRVTPVYDGKNLVATGVIMEAWSVEDNGKILSFNVFVYNVQPGVIIDYRDGSSRLEK